MKNSKILVGGLFLFALTLRCLFISTRGIQYDDAFSILLAQRSLPEIVQGTAADTMPPLYYFLLHFWMLVSMEIWWYRLLSVFLSMGSLAFLYLIVRKLTSKSAAAWALFFGAVSSFQIYHAQDIRMYALLQFFQTGYIYFFILLIRNENPKVCYWAGLILAGTGAFYTHNLGAFFLLAPNIYLLIRRNWKLQTRLIASQTGMFLLFLPWAVFLPGQLDKIQNAFWTPRPGVIEIIQAVITFTGSLTLPQPALQVVAVVGTMVFILTILFSVRTNRIPVENKILLLTLIFWTPLVLFLLSYMMRPVFVARAFIVSSLFFYGLFGILIAAGRTTWMKILPLVAVLIAAGLSVPNTYTFDRFPRSPFQKAMETVQAHTNQGALIVHDNKLSYFPGIVYYPEVEQVFIADTPGSANDTFALASQKAMALYPQESIQQAVDGYSAVDFLVFSRTIREYQQLGYEQHPHIAWLDENFSFQEVVQVGDLEIYRYTR